MLRRLHPRCSLWLNAALALFCAAAFLLVLLWLFQVVFLDTFYRIIKTQSIEATAETISKNVDNPQFEDLLDRVAHQSSICVLVFDGENNPIYSVESSPDCVIHKLPTEVIGFYRQRAAESGGQIFCQNIFPCGLRAGKEQVLSAEKSGGGSLPNFFSIV